MIPLPLVFRLNGMAVIVEAMTDQRHVRTVRSEAVCSTAKSQIAAIWHLAATASKINRVDLHATGGKRAVLARESRDAVTAPSFQPGRPESTACAVATAAAWAIESTVLSSKTSLANARPVNAIAMNDVVIAATHAVLAELVGAHVWALRLVAARPAPAFVTVALASDADTMVARAAPRALCLLQNELVPATL